MNGLYGCVKEKLNVSYKDILMNAKTALEIHHDVSFLGYECTIMESLIWNHCGCNSKIP